MRFTTLSVVYCKCYIVAEIRRHKKVEEYVNEVRAEGRFSFTIDELREQFNMTDKSLFQVLFRLKKKNLIIQVFNGFYGILSLEYRKSGTLPVSLFLDHLMAGYLNKDYYLGLYSAAKYHGASHQAHMVNYVVTKPPALRKIEKGDMRIRFHVKKSWHQDDVRKMKSDTGYFNVSSAPLTALDLLYFPSVPPEIAITVIDELSETIQPKDLFDCASRYPFVSSVQRLGYMLSKVIGAEDLGDVLKEVLSEKKLQYIKMHPGLSATGKRDSEFKVIVNTHIESDL